MNVTNAIPPAVWLVALPHTGLDPPFSSRVFCRWIIDLQFVLCACTVVIANPDVLAVMQTPVQ